MCYAEAVGVNHGVLYKTSGCESLYAMLSQKWGIMVNYDVPVVVNHDELCCASGCDPLCVMLSQWV